MLSVAKKRTPDFPADKIGPDGMPLYEEDYALFVRIKMGAMQTSCSVREFCRRVGISPSIQGRQSRAYRRLLDVFREVADAGDLVLNGQKYRVPGSAVSDRSSV
ncbi:MAG: hypothetical protein KGI71_04765 [Patescibacteria group bacterium]|nr:hypothetical protein [Patescibacteria group bacterium]